jgi:hypothetical protein
MSGIVALVDATFHDHARPPALPDVATPSWFHRLIIVLREREGRTAVLRALVELRAEGCQGTKNALERTPVNCAG